MADAPGVQGPISYRPRHLILGYLGKASRRPLERAVGGVLGSPVRADTREAVPGL